MREARTIKHCRYNLKVPFTLFFSHLTKKNADGVLSSFGNEEKIRNKGQVVEEEGEEKKKEIKPKLAHNFWVESS
jgi:hypothetical protein